MSESSSSSRSTRASSSRTRSTTSGTGTPSATSSGVTLHSSASSTSLVSLTDASGTAVFTNSASLTTSTVSATAVPGAAVQKGPSAAVVVLIVLGILLLASAGVGLTCFLRKRKVKQRSAKDLLEANHEPKPQESVIPDTVPYFPTATDQSHVYPLGGGARSISKQKSQSSRASSSIVLSDEDLPMNSRSNFLRPLSLGESTSSLTLRGMQLANDMPTVAEDQNSPKLPPNLPITTTPGRVEMPQDEEKMNVAPSHIFTLTHFGTPDPSPVPSIRGPSPSTVPFVHRSFDASVNRNSYASLAPSLRGGSMNERSRPQSMASVYSTQTQNQPDMPDTLAPDVLAALDRLKKRISTPWSIASADTYRADRNTLSRTEEV
ncbi:hypothetical protein BDV93DRAFT_560255 [Ceratobasidium sp. AG-I]|nr:hypothetical protein BDV93DRAFT_560255 [Ceratobasidium sp. AG-I]